MRVDVSVIGPTRGSLHKEEGVGAHPHSAGQGMGCLFSTELPMDAPLSNCTEAEHVLPTSPPALFSELWK